MATSEAPQPSSSTEGGPKTPDTKPATPAPAASQPGPAPLPDTGASKKSSATAKKATSSTTATASTLDSKAPVASGTDSNKKDPMLEMMDELTKLVAEMNDLMIKLYKKIGNMAIDKYKDYAREKVTSDLKQVDSKHEETLAGYDKKIDDIQKHIDQCKDVLAESTPEEKDVKHKALTEAGEELAACKEAKKQYEDHYKEIRPILDRKAERRLRELDPKTEDKQKKIDALEGKRDDAKMELSNVRLKEQQKIAYASANPALTSEEREKRIAQGNANIKKAELKAQEIDQNCQRDIDLYKKGQEPEGLMSRAGSAMKDMLKAGIARLTPSPDSATPSTSMQAQQDAVTAHTPGSAASVSMTPTPSSPGPEEQQKSEEDDNRASI